MRYGITESALRSALKTELGRHMPRTDLLLEELNVELGAVRADVVIAGDLLQAFEIKSDFDTLDRLARQMHAYHRVFDRVSLVTTTTFIGAAQQLLPPWWGLILAEQSASAVELTELRDATPHPRQELREMALLLWRDEALAIALDLMPDRVRARNTREELCEMIAGAGDFDQVRRWVVQGLKQRSALKASPALSRPRASLAV